MGVQSEPGLIHNFGGIKGIREKWIGFLILGIILSLLGLFVINHAFTATVFSVFLFGTLLMAGGIIQIIESFWAEKWSGVFLSLMIGILYLVTGFLCVAKPGVSALSLTLFIAAFCFIAGLFRMIAALWYRFDQWGWVFFNGLVTFILGWLIFSDWPVSGLWVIGLFIGIDMLLAGITWVLLSLKARISA